MRSGHRVDTLPASACNDLRSVRLQSLQIDGYKRFGDGITTLRIRGRTLAVLGHNESGKTSLLSAVAHIGRNGFAAATEFTDRTPRPPGHRILSARFLLDAADIAAVDAALENRFVQGEIEAGRAWHVFKRANGSRQYDTLPELTRDTAPRKALSALLQSLSGPEWESMPIAALNADQHAEIRSAMEQAAAALKTDAVTLPADAQDALTSLKAGIDSWVEAAGTSDPVLQDLQQQLSRVEADERADSPAYAAAHALFARLPPFLLFDEAARTLPSFTPFTDTPSAALINLLAAGGSSFDELSSLAGSDDGRESLIEEEKQVNLRLEDLFNAWSQRRVCAVIKVDPNGIGVLGRDRAAPIPDPPLSQRSEGMRTFAALLAFLHAQRAEWSNPPVLLVDEAELHLHYDAQADLVEVFERQELAQCVIYTTHSVGCLPEDLGLGLVVVEESGNERSRVSQSFWTGGPGLTPVMLALGATALSFTPARRVMIGEGAHEAILLPTLLRQTREGTPPHMSLGFQIVGGLAEVSAGTAARLEEEAGTVVYVVDNDSGGAAAAAVLPQHVRDSGRVLTLGAGTDAQCIEDFVNATILVKAVDEVLTADGHPTRELSPDAIPATGRAAWLGEVLTAAGSPEARTRLAQAAVVLGAGGDLAESSRIESLRTLLSSARQAFPAGP
jgi:hypothetical protein